MNLSTRVSDAKYMQILLFEMREAANIFSGPTTLPVATIYSPNLERSRAMNVIACFFEGKDFVAFAYDRLGFVVDDNCRLDSCTVFGFIFERFLL